MEIAILDQILGMFCLMASWLIKNHQNLFITSQHLYCHS